MMGRLSIDDKVWAKKSKSEFLNNFKQFDKYFEGGAEAYYDKIKEKYKKKSSKTID